MRYPSLSHQRNDLLLQAESNPQAHESIVARHSIEGVFVSNLARAKCMRERFVADHVSPIEKTEACRGCFVKGQRCEIRILSTDDVLSGHIEKDKSFFVEVTSKAVNVCRSAKATFLSERKSTEEAFACHAIPHKPDGHISLFSPNTLEASWKSVRHSTHAKGKGISSALVARSRMQRAVDMDGIHVYAAAFWSPSRLSISQ